MTEIFNEASNDNQTPDLDDAGQWVDRLPDDLRQVALNKGWREPADALKSYKHLEEFLGAEKSGRGLVLPKGEDDVDGYARLYQALGRPENPEGYDFKEVLGEADIDPEFSGAMGEAMHQAGLSKRQAQEMARAWQEQLSKYAASEDSRYEAEKTEVLEAVPPARLETAKRGFRSMGFPAALAEKIERSLGPKTAVELFARIGETLIEDRQVAESKALGFTGSPEAARRRMDRLMADPAFSQRYLGGDKNALDEISELARRATVK